MFYKKSKRISLLYAGIGILGMYSTFAKITKDMVHADVPCAPLSLPDAKPGQQHIHYKVSSHTGTQLHSDTIPVIADSYLYGNSTNQNNGAASTIVVKYTSSSSNTYNRISLLKFGIGGVDTSKGRIVQALLQLHVSSTDAIGNATQKSNMNNTQYVVGNLKDNSWDEATVTWGNYANIASASTTIASLMGSAIQFTGSSYPLSLVTGQPLNWNIAGQVRGNIQKGKNAISLTVSSPAVSANMGANFYAREYAGAGHDTLQPRLIIIQDADIAFTQPGDNAATVFDSIMQNIRSTLYGASPSIGSLNSNVTNYQNAINADGSWSDISYTNTAQTNWLPLTHLDRVKTMALAYTTSGSTFYQNATLYQNIVHAMQYWYNVDPRSSNWYNQQIASPQRVGQILILMRNGLTAFPDLLEMNLLGRMASIGGAPDQSGSQGTGANKLNIAMHWIYRGCLTEDNAVLAKGVSQAYYPLFLTTDEGIQYDYAYKQHGAQLYIGGYGWDLINGESSVALYTVGTSYALGGQQLDILSTYTRETYLGVIRGKNFLYNVLGRGLSRAGGLNQSGFTTQINQMKLIDPVHTDEYNRSIARLNGSEPASYGILPFNRHYFSTDYTLHTRPNYFFDVRTVSTRTLRNENGNSENILGYFLSDGGTDISIDGTEYYNIFPVWDWAMIPGTTARHMSTATIPVPAQWGTSGTTSFVGGVSDSLYGISVYDLNNNNTSGKKSWFYFDDEIVCLGAGIKSTASEEVNTTLNQCLLNGNVQVSSGGSTNSYAGNTTNLNYSDNLDWAWHYNIGYVFPQGGNIGLTAKQQTGNWYTINTSQTDATVTNNVFTLWVKHGIAPSAAKYAYIVTPNKTAAEMPSYTAANPVVIAQNNDTVQAVFHKNLNRWGLAFYKGNAVFQNDSVKIWTDNPALLMLHPVSNNQIGVQVSDPSQSLASVTVYLKYPGINGTKQQTISLPAAPYLGKSVSYVFDSQSPDYLAPAPVVSDTLTPVADAYVRDGSYASTNYGTVELQAKHETTGYSRQSFLRFDLNALNLSKGNIQSVQLILNVSSSGTSVATNPYYAVFTSDNSWGENTVTWNNKPTTDDTLGYVMGKTSGAMQWDITNKVSTLISNNNKTFSVNINAVAPDPNNNSQGWIIFYSKETGTSTLLKPQLVVIYAENTLPVTLFGLKVQNSNDANLLRWKTAQESNVSHFEIERSGDGRQFATIGSTAANGSTTIATDYHYQDAQPADGWNYYRIRAVDLNGASTLSEIVSIQHNEEKKHLQISATPNPARSFVNIRSPQSGTLQVVNSAGKVILQQQITANADSWVRTSSWAKGVYFLRIGTLTAQLVVQ